MTEAERLLLLLVADMLRALLAMPQPMADMLRDARQALDDEAFAEHARAAPQRHAQGVEAPVGYHEAQQRLNAASDAPAGSTGISAMEAQVRKPWGDVRPPDAA